MKVYNRNDFMMLPCGTLYIKYTEKWSGDGSYLVKMDTIYNGEKPIDWNYLEIDIESKDSDERLCMLDKSLDEEISLKSWIVCSRDGFFDDGDMFLVFEKEDLISLRKLIGDCISVCNGINLDMRSLCAF